MSLTTIVLADDHSVVRAGLRALLEAHPMFSVVGEAADGRETLSLVANLRPHVLILDLMMPGLTGLEVTRHVRQRSPETHIIILSMHRHEAYVNEALRSGAAGYVLKNADADHLVAAVREVTSGRRYLSPPLSERTTGAAETERASPLACYEMLTFREREVLVLAAEGRRNGAIATRLVISPRTAEFHRANVMRKMGLRTQTDLVRYALRSGIIPGIVKASGS